MSVSILNQQPHIANPLLEVDLDAFWKADEIAHRDNCFSEEATQIALGIRMSDECVYAELNEPGDPWGSEPRERRIELNKRYNDLSEKIVGKRLLQEVYLPTDAHFPQVKQIGEVFGGTYAYIPNVGQWLSSPLKTYQDLERKLDEVDKMDLHTFLLPSNWISEKKRIYETYGLSYPVNRHVRGPVTLATSLFGEENLIFLYYDAPELFQRFSQTIQTVILKMYEILDIEAGFTPLTAPKGFSFADDNCSLFTPEMYELFGYPVLKAVFERFSPNPGDNRYQHSDSEMAHLLPQLGKLNLTGCNFGPTLTVEEIRRHLPNTRIDGQLAPFTFMKNNHKDIIAEVRRDCEMGKVHRGLNLSTAGSINNGSLLTSMRAVMYAIQTYGQYD